MSDWNAKADAIAAEMQAVPLMRAHSRAILQVAMFEAIKAVEPRDRPERMSLSAEESIMVEAAAAAAAHDVLVALYPDQSVDLSVALVASLAKLDNGVPKARGYVAGKNAAASVLRRWFNASGRKDMARQIGGAFGTSQ
jgi:hypothetical protein